MKFSSRLAVAFGQSIDSRCYVVNEDVVEAAPTGDAPTTSEWSTSLLPTKLWLILKVWWYVLHCGIDLWRLTFLLFPVKSLWMTTGLHWYHDTSRPTVVQVMAWCCQATSHCWYLIPWLMMMWYSFTSPSNTLGKLNVLHNAHSLQCRVLFLHKFVVGSQNSPSRKGRIGGILHSQCHLYHGC